MKEGTVPVPPSDPAFSDNDLVPDRGLSYLGGHSGGGETPVSIQFVIEYFSRPPPLIRSAKGLSDLKRIIWYASEDPYCMALSVSLQFPCEK